MKKLFAILAIISSAILLSGCVDEQRQRDDFDEGYESAMIEVQEKESELEEAKNCISLWEEKASSTNDQVYYISSDLESSLGGDYYDLYDASESARFDLQMLDFLDPCR
jgi:hypothetical protein